MDTCVDGWVRGSYQLFLEWLPEIAAPHSAVPRARHLQSATQISFPTAEDLLTSKTTAGEGAFFFSSPISKRHCSATLAKEDGNFGIFCHVCNFKKNAYSKSKRQLQSSFSPF